MLDHGRATAQASAGPLAVQDGLPVICPRVQPTARGLQLQVVVVAGGEEDVLPAGVRLGPCDVRPVIYEKVSRDHSLVSSQHDLLQEVGAKVLLHPGILQATEEKMTSDEAGDGSTYDPSTQKRRLISRASSDTSAQEFCHLHRKTSH